MDYKVGITVALLSYVLWPNNANAGSVSITPSIDFSYLYSDNLNATESNASSEQILQLTPAMHMHSEGAILESNLNYQYTRLQYAERSELNKGYDSFSGQALFKLFDNRLRTTVRASKSRQQNSFTAPQSSFAVSPQTDIVQYSLSNQFTSQLDNLVNYSLNWQINKTEATQVEKNTPSSLNNSDSQFISINLSNGDFFKSSYWSIRANKSFIEYDRIDTAMRTEQTLEELSAELGYGIYESLSMFAQYYDEDYDVLNVASPNITSSSYGLGLRWQPSPKAYFKLAYNWAIDDLNSNFISTDLHWSPSRRTSLNLSSSKRFFGDAYQASFTHRLKRITTSLSYSESITSFRTSSFGSQQSGNFICPNTPNFSIADCTFAAGTTPNLGSGQQLIPVNVLAPELSDNTYLNKQINGSISYRMRKTNFQIGYSNSRRTNVNTNIKNLREAISFNSGYKLNRQNSLNISIRIEDFDTLSATPSALNYTDNQYILGYTTKFGQQMSLNVQLMHRLRDSKNSAGNFTENRATLTLHKGF